MSDPNNNGPKPPPIPRPGGKGAGKSGSAGEIGAELGGELDFEPDALLDSLLAEDSDPDPELSGPSSELPAALQFQDAPAAGDTSGEWRAVNAPTPESTPPPSKPGPKLHEPSTRLFSADDDTKTFHGPSLLKEVAEKTENEKLPDPQAPEPEGELQSVEDLLGMATMPDVEEENEVEAPESIVPEPSEPASIAEPEVTAAPEVPGAPAAPKVGGAATRAKPPLPPRPGGIPRPGGPSIDATRTPPAVNPAGPPPREPFPPAVSPAAPPAFGGGSEEPPADIETAPLGSLDVEASVEAEVASSAEVWSNSEDWGESEVNAPFEAESSGTFGGEDLEELPDEASLEVQGEESDVYGDLEELADDEIAASVQLDPPSVDAAPDPGEERRAELQLAEQELLEEWVSRAGWLMQEAETAADPAAKSRLLLVASELFAMAGEADSAVAAAKSAAAATPNAALAQRQSRWLAQAAGEWSQVAQTLDQEARTSPTPESKAHAAYFSAEIHARVLADGDQAQKRLDMAARLHPTDARSHVVKLAQTLAKDNSPPRARMPDAPTLATLSAAARELTRRRGGPATPGAGDASPTVTWADARRAFSAGDGQQGSELVAELARVPGLEAAAGWLTAALFAPQSATRAQAIEHLKQLLARHDSPLLRRSLAARALEAGDGEGVAKALAADAEADEQAFEALDRVALGVLTQAPADSLSAPLQALAEMPEAHPLAAAGNVTLGISDGSDLASSDPHARAKLVLGRALGRGDREELSAATNAFADENPSTPLGQVLDLERAAAQRDGNRVASLLSAWAGEGDPVMRDLAAGLAYELAGTAEEAADRYRSANDTQPANEAGLRALLASVGPEQALTLLESAASAADGDGAKRSLLLTEAALRVGFEAPQFQELLERARDTDPTLPLPHRLGEQLSRMRGDAAGLLDWLRARRDASEDAIERAHDQVREALLTADEDLDGAANLIDEAIEARPNDVALRELSERLHPGRAQDAGSWREQVAEQADEGSKARLLLEAALAHERQGDLQAASRTAEAAVAAGGGQVAQLVLTRILASSSSAKLTDELMAQAKEEEDAERQRELYQRLSALDEGRGDSSSALLWQSAILERSPHYLPALQRLEQAYISGARDEDLETVASALAEALTGEEASGHGWLAAHLRMRFGEWGSATELVKTVAGQLDPTPLWALRQTAAHAARAGDDETVIAANEALAARVQREVDGATLRLRAAEAAARLGQADKARELLDKAIEQVPEHLVALTTRAEVLEAADAHEAAADALEAIAQASQVPAHRLEFWHQAAVMWLDRVENQERGLLALERAADLDVTHEDTFERLQSMYVSLGERSKLAELLERRLAETTDPAERVALEVTRGRALAEIGDSGAAKQALAAALDANPDHIDALEAFADLCAKEEDWDGAEQAWIRLARHQSEPQRQAGVYRKLGELYDTHLPNPERAELAYREVLKREPEDTDATERLVQVYGRLGNADEALRLQTELLQLAQTPEEKRDRTLELALVLEQIAGDRRKAEATLDKARKAHPQDALVLQALAEFYQRHGEDAALKVLLDRAANDARRALSTGRFDAGFFRLSATVSELRGNADGALIARATLAALEGGAPIAIQGAGAAGGAPALDDVLAPDLLSPPLRSLLAKAGDALDAAYPLDLRSIRAQMLPAEAGDIKAQLQQLGATFGVHNIEVFVSPNLGLECTAVSTAPPQLVIGQELLQTEDAAVRFFLLFRALKTLQGHAAALSRTAPIDLAPVFTAFLSVFADNWTPQGVDAKKFAVAKQRIAQALPRNLDNDVPVLALEVIGALGNRATQLGTAIHEWGNRTALLGIGDPMACLRGISLSAQGAPIPESGPDRLKWIQRNPEARDLAVFSVSDRYTEARKRAGIA